MRRIAVALLATAAVLPAFAQVDCGEPLTDQDAKFGIDYSRNVTLPLIEHNAGGLGPVLWAYIAGQARGESLGNMRDEHMDFTPKPNLNLWNVQTDATSTCRSDTEVVCPDTMKSLPPIPRKPIAYNGCFVNAAGEQMKWTVVCFPKYPSVQKGADGYLLPFKNYTKRLQELSKGNPTPEDFFSELKGTRWADSADKPHYRTDTLDAIRQVLRGLATVRIADQAALNDVSKQIDAWCAQSGQGDSAERAALSAKQAALLKSLSTVGGVCTAPTGATPPKANSAIDTCRMQPDPPLSEPTGPAGHGGASGQGPTDRDRSGGSDHRPSGYATGTGEPHYRLPGGHTLSTQRAGEFWLLDAPDGTRIQVRQVPWGQSRQVAAIGAIAAQAGAHRVGVYVDGRVLVDGKALAWTGRFHQQALGQDAVVGVWGPRERPSQVAVMWRNGRTLRIHLRSSWLDVETTWARGTSAATDRASSAKPLALLVAHSSAGMVGADSWRAPSRRTRLSSVGASRPRKVFSTTGRASRQRPSTCATSLRSLPSRPESRWRPRVQRAPPREFPLTA